MTNKVIVNGAHGRMGSVTCKTIQDSADFQLVASCERQDDLSQAIKQHQADIVIDFTSAEVSFENAKTIINANARPVIGTTGLQLTQIEQLKTLCQEKKLGGVIAPNFSIGAILLMQFSEKAARYLPHVEVIEMHHDGKADAPSGTAMKTCEMIANARKEIIEDTTSTENVKGARGARYQDVPVHSVRLPGLVAHQMVMFGGTGETLTLRHDSIDRECFMPGVLLACEKVMELEHLVYGLEHLL